MYLYVPPRTLKQPRRFEAMLEFSSPRPIIVSRPTNVFDPASLNLDGELACFLCLLSRHGIIDYSHALNTINIE